MDRRPRDAADGGAHTTPASTTASTPAAAPSGTAQLAALVAELTGAALGAGAAATRHAITTLAALLEDDDAPRMRRLVPRVCAVMLAVARQEGADVSAREAAWNWIATAAETHSAVVRKAPDLPRGVVYAALAEMSAGGEEGMGEADADADADGDADGDAGGGDADGDDWPGGAVSSSAASALDRVATAVGGKTMWPLVRAAVAPLAASDDWHDRAAAFAAICVVTEGCKAAIAPTARTVVDSVTLALKDDHPRVRRAALRCLGQMITDLSGVRVRGKKVRSLLDAAADALVPAVIDALGPRNAGEPRNLTLAGQAAVALVGADDFEARHLGDHTAALLAALFAAIRDCATPEPVEACLTVVGVVARVLGDAFAPHYASFAPLVTSVLVAHPGAAGMRVRGAALQAFSMVMQAVGREVAGADAADALNAIIAMLGALHTGSSDVDYLFSALVRIAATLADGVTPYLPTIMPPLCAAAVAHVAVRVTKGDEVEDDDDDAGGHAGLAVADFTTGADDVRHRVAIDSAALTTRLAALTAVVNLVDDLGCVVPAFAAHLDAVMDVANVDATFASLREMALTGIAPTVTAALCDTAHPGHAQEVFNAVLHALLRQSEAETDVKVLQLLAEVLCTIFRTAYNSLAHTAAGVAASPDRDAGSDATLAAVVAAMAANPTQAAEAEAPTGDAPHTFIVVPMEVLPAVLARMRDMMKDSQERQAATVAEAGDAADGSDEEERERLEEALEPESDVVASCVDVVGYCIKTHRERVVPFVLDTLAPSLLPALASTHPAAVSLRIAATCMCIDLVEYASPLALGVVDALLPAIVEGASAANPLLRQVCIYSLGVCAQRVPLRVAPLAADIADILGAVLTAPGARSSENGTATDNALSSLIKVAAVAGGELDTDAVMSAVLAYLPLRHDAVEARLVHGALVEALATGDPLWLGRDSSRMPAALRAMADVLLAHAAAVAGGAAARAAGDDSGDDGDDGGDGDGDCAMGDDDDGGGGDGDDDDDDDEDDDEGGDERGLLHASHLAALKAACAAVKASPASAVVLALVRRLKPQQREALAGVGLA